MATDSIAGYIQGPDGVAFSHTAHALDLDSRKLALAHLLGQTNALLRLMKPHFWLIEVS